MECEMPQINSNQEEMKKYFQETKTIAVLGASPKEEKDSHKVAKYLLENGFKMIPVYPKVETILGEKAYSSLDEIEENVDMVVVFRKPEAVTGIVDAILKRDDVKTLWLQIGIVNNKASQKAKDKGLNVVQSHCAMVEHKAIFKD